MTISENLATLNNNSSETIRKKIKIPNLPNDTEDLKYIPEMHMHKCKLINEELIFEKPQHFYEVLKTGFFLLKIPSLINLEASDKFVNNFYKEKDGSIDDGYKGFKNVKLIEDYQGYFDRPNDQWENFYIESLNWNKFLPKDVIAVGFNMAELGIKILKNIFKKILIPKSDWDKVSGGLTAHRGHQMLAFNHFRPEKKMRGTKLHRDSGWITILRSLEPGLIALVDNKLYAVNPTPGYFTVNFGSTIEVLTENLTVPVRANIHGVVKTLKKNNNGRTSYVIFLDSDLSDCVYRYKNWVPIPIQTMKEFSIQEVSRTYNNDEYL
jgi:hypothetical protein